MISDEYHVAFDFKWPTFLRIVADALEGIGNTRQIVQEFLKDVRGIVGQALYAAQTGIKHHDAKPVKGFVGSSAVKIAANFDRAMYRSCVTCVSWIMM